MTSRSIGQRAISSRSAGRAEEPLRSATAGAVAFQARTRYSPGVRKVVATLALLGLLTSPVVAQTRLFCKFTGVEITDCLERDVPAAPTVRSGDCCDRVSLPLLDHSNVPLGNPFVALPVLAALPSGTLLLPAPLLRVAVDQPFADAGPPLFVQHRALLI